MGVALSDLSVPTGGDLGGYDQLRFPYAEDLEWEVTRNIGYYK